MKKTDLLNAINAFAIPAGQEDVMTPWLDGLRAILAPIAADEDLEHSVIYDFYTRLTPMPAEIAAVTPAENLLPELPETTALANQLKSIFELSYPNLQQGVSLVTANLENFNAFPKMNSYEYQIKLLTHLGTLADDATLPSFQKKLIQASINLAQNLATNNLADLTSFILQLDTSNYGTAYLEHPTTAIILAAIFASMQYDIIIRPEGVTPEHCNTVIHRVISNLIAHDMRPKAATTCRTVAEILVANQHAPEAAIYITAAALIELPPPPPLSFFHAAGSGHQPPAPPGPPAPPEPPAGGLG